MCNPLLPSSQEKKFINKDGTCVLILIKFTDSLEINGLIPRKGMINVQAKFMRLFILLEKSNCSNVKMYI